jgi:hypothetical protein
MPSLTRTPTGGYACRVRIPKDVRDEYGRRFGKRHEAKFHAPASTSLVDARRLYGEWLAQHEANVASIRAQQAGGGTTLTFRAANELAADWYRWFVGKYEDSPGDRDWEGLLDAVVDALKDKTREEDYEREGNWTASGCRGSR